MQGFGIDEKARRDSDADPAGWGSIASDCGIVLPVSCAYLMRYRDRGTIGIRDLGVAQRGLLFIISSSALPSRLRLGSFAS